MPPRRQEAFAHPYEYVEKIPVTKTFDELLAEINEYGWSLNNLCQISNRRFWRANVRHVMQDKDGVDQYSHEFCDAETVEEALTGVILNMKLPRNAHTAGIPNYESGHGAIGIKKADAITTADREAIIESIVTLKAEIDAWLGRIK